MVLQRRARGEFWRALHPDQRAWSNGLPAVGYCIFASGDRLMSFSDGNWTTYVAVEPMSPSADWQSLSCPVKGFCAAGTTCPGYQLCGPPGEREVEGGPGPGRQLLRGGGGCGMHGEGHVHSGWCVWFYGPSRDVVRRGMDCERGPLRPAYDPHRRRAGAPLCRWRRSRAQAPVPV